MKFLLHLYTNIGLSITVLTSDLEKNKSKVAELGPLRFLRKIIDVSFLIENSFLCACAELIRNLSSVISQML